MEFCPENLARYHRVRGDSKRVFASAEDFLPRCAHSFILKGLPMTHPRSSNHPEIPLTRARSLVSRYVMGIIGVLIFGGMAIGSVLTRELEVQESRRNAEQLLQTLGYSLRFDLLSGNLIMTEERIKALLGQGFQDHACITITEPDSPIPALRSGVPKICNQKSPEIHSLEHLIYYDEERTQVAYRIVLHYRNLPIGVPIPKFVIGSALALLTLVFFAVSQMSRALSAIFDRILELTSVKSLEELPQEPDPIQEVESVRLSAVQLKQQENERLKVEIKRAELGAIQAVQAQVAHDVRSPLSALASIEKDLSTLPEETRILIRSSVSRIQDIANQLTLRNRIQKEALDRSSHSQRTATEEQEARQTLLLAPLVELLVSEKRLQYRSKLRLQIELEQHSNAYGAFVEVQPTELRRALSNLIDNAAEAMEHQGPVKLRLIREGQKILIQIQDQGKGIPESVLPSIGQRGFSYGKPAGSGLGVAHAIQWAKRWSGDLAIQSQENKGTTVELILPLAAEPEWFPLELPLIRPSMGTLPSVVILDDDSTIHQIWRSKLEGQAKLHHFSHTGELEHWWNANAPQEPHAFFLIDFEIIGDSRTGLHMIEQLKLQNRALLVTSHFEDRNLVERCKKLQISILPKPLASFIPVRVHPAIAVLVDDDPLVHLTWKKAAQRRGITLKNYTGSKALLEEAHTLSRDIPCYLDVQLGPEDYGPDLAVKLHAMGFHELEFVTGLDPKEVPTLPFVKKIGGKTPPF
jgi:signal transduction histidine kinase